MTFGWDRTKPVGACPTLRRGNRDTLKTHPSGPACPLGGHGVPLKKLRDKRVLEGVSQIHISLVGHGYTKPLKKG